MEEQLELFKPTTTCADPACKKETETPLWIVKHTGRSTLQLPYCNQDCANHHYLHRLREQALL